MQQPQETLLPNSKPRKWSVATALALTAGCIGLLGCWLDYPSLTMSFWLHMFSSLGFLACGILRMVEKSKA